jgi:NAD+ synthase (glutamine-hydrolysing)
MRVLIVQGAPVIGDVERNADALVRAVASAHQSGARLVVGSELHLSGYPPRDLLERADLIAACRVAAERVAAATAGSDVIAVFGTPWWDGGLRNSAIVAAGGRIVDVRHKSLLPTYDVFDEGRYFVPESDPKPTRVDGVLLGVTICEDMWCDPDLGRTYAFDPIERMRGCDLLVNLSASPFQAGKGAVRVALARRKVAIVGAPLVYVNQVGANDELLFDGASLVLSAAGAVTYLGPSFLAASVVVDVPGEPVAHAPPPFEEEVLGALEMGVRDYAARCGFRTAVLGLSGGIDSALVAVVAARALGPENVYAVGMPGPYSSPGSVADAEALAHNLGIHWDLVPITDTWRSFLGALAPSFGERPADVTEENLQARVRGTVLMALSNKFGHLVLTTGNKSEVSVGYCTLYGDMNGGLAVISDVWKTDVYRIANWINRHSEVIPFTTISKPPSAELAPNQTDQDSLPPYEVLDAVLRAFIEGGASRADLVRAGHSPNLVDGVLRLVARNEYKRWQAAPGLRVSSRAFGVGRRVPLAHVWR